MDKSISITPKVYKKVYMIIPCKAILWYFSNLTFSQGLRDSWMEADGSVIVTVLTSVVKIYLEKEPELAVLFEVNNGDEL